MKENLEMGSKKPVRRGSRMRIKKMRECAGECSHDIKKKYVGGDVLEGLGQGVVFCSKKRLLQRAVP